MLINFSSARYIIFVLQLPSIMLNNIVSALAIAASVSATYAFSPSPSSNHNKNWRDISDLSYQNDPATMMDHNMMVPPPPAGAFQPDLDNIMETYDRAADCANNYGMCSIEELLDLSEGKIYLI